MSDDIITVFKAELKGLNAIPSNESKAEGIAILKYDNMTNRFTAKISYNGLEPNSGHIHMAQKKENGNVIFPFREILYFSSSNRLDENLIESEMKGVLKGSHMERDPSEVMLLSLPFEKNDLSSPLSLHSKVLTNAQVDALFSGEMYVDFHTNVFPNGEIRGQLEKQ